MYPVYDLTNTKLTQSCTEIPAKCLTLVTDKEKGRTTVFVSLGCYKPRKMPERIVSIK